MVHPEFEKTKKYVESEGTEMVPLAVAESVVLSIYEEFGCKIEEAVKLIQTTIGVKQEE